MTGHVIVAGTAYPNAWVEDGKAFRLVLCPLCNDTGINDGEFCDCATGEEMADSAELRAIQDHLRRRAFEVYTRTPWPMGGAA